MYFIIDLPKFGSYEQIWVAVDTFSKMAHFISLKNRQVGNLGKVFVREICRLHGLPLGVVSDKDNVFTSKLWSEVM